MHVSLQAKRTSIFTPCVATLLATLACSATAASGAPVIQILRGSAQQTTYGAAFSVPLTVWVIDSATRRPIAGARVNFVPGHGVGLTPSYAVTDEKGLASVTATGLQACTSSAAAEIAGVPGSRVEFDDLQVDKAPLTVLPDDLVSPAGSEIPIVANYSFVGFVNGDTVDSAHITGTPTLTTTAADIGLHANYAIKGGVGTLSAPNYTFVPGFGTLAIVGSSSADSLMSQTEIPSAVPASEDAAAGVRPALANQRAVASLSQPAFIAGLRGESGVFVRAAIWPQPLAASALPSADTRSAMLVVVASRPMTPAAPVRSVPLPTLAAAGSLTAALPTRAAVTAPLDSKTLSQPAAPVRAVMLPGQSTVPSASSAFTGSSIRRAFNVPASK